MATRKTEQPDPQPAGTTHYADDVSNEPTGAVEQPGPVTVYADHVPDGAPQLMGKMVAPPTAPDGPASATQAQTA